MDIQTLREAFTPETWQALRQYFIREVLAESEAKFRQTPSLPPSPVNPVANSRPALLNPVKPVRGIRSLELPPPLDVSLLAYQPAKIRGRKWRNEAIAVRRNFIIEALKRAAADGISEEEILEHLVAARFPVGDDYYGKILSGKPRIYGSISNDLHLFLHLKWVRKLGKGHWKWVGSKMLNT